MRSAWQGLWAANLLKGALDVLPSLGEGVAAILSFPSERPSASAQSHARVVVHTLQARTTDTFRTLAGDRGWMSLSSSQTGQQLTASRAAVNCCGKQPLPTQSLLPK